MKKLLAGVVLLAGTLCACGAQPAAQSAVTLPMATERPGAVDLPEEPEATPQPTPRPDITSLTTADLTLEEKVGQLFIVRPDALDLTLPQETIDDAKADGVTELTDAMRGTLLFLLCAVLCLWGFWRQADPTRPAGVPLSAYTGSLPFPRMEDLTGSTDFTPLDMSREWNTVREGSDPLAPVTISLKQVGSCGGFSGGLTVEYYELRTPFLARRLADEYMRLAKGGSHYDVLPLPDLGVDRADGYTDIFPTVILVEDCRLLRVTLWQTGSRQIPLEDWTAAYARALLAAGS